MIVVTKVETVEVEDDIARFAYCNANPYALHPSENDIKIVEKVVRGVRLVRRDGKILVIGLSDEVEKTLAIACQSWKQAVDDVDRLHEERDSCIEKIDFLRKDNETWKTMLDAIRKANFWQRLRFLIFRNFNLF